MYHKVIFIPFLIFLHISYSPYGLLRIVEKKRPKNYDDEKGARNEIQVALQNVGNLGLNIH